MDPLYHIAVPLAIVIALGWDRREALLMAPFAVLPDLDALLPDCHRLVLHNLFVCLLLPAAVALWARRTGRETVARRSLLAMTFLLSHLVLDLSGGVALLWPLTTEAVEASFVLRAGFDPFWLEPVLRVGWSAGPPAMVEVDAVSHATVEVAILSVLALAAAKVAGLETWRGRPSLPSAGRTVGRP